MEIIDDGFDWIRELPIYLPVDEDNIYIGMKVRIREDSEYYRVDDPGNPIHVIGVVCCISNEMYSYGDLCVGVEWFGKFVNNYDYSDLEYLYK